MKLGLYLSVGILGSFVASAGALCPTVHRNQTVLRHFQVTHPCPSTGQTHGACPGFILDHMIPLCLTGARGDTVENLQWQTVAAAKAKDILEKELCRTLCACIKGP